MAIEDKNLLAFRGGSCGFVTNHYAVWQSGLDGESPNVWARGAGIRTSIAALQTHSVTNSNSIYKQLIDFLWKVQRQEAEKEEEWIRQKIAQFSQFDIDSKYLKEIQNAIERKEYGLAYTLMTQANKDLQELKREIGINGSSLARLNKFWKAQFESYFIKKLDEAFLKKEKGQLDANITIDEIIKQWIEELLIDAKVADDSIVYISTTMESGLISLFEKRGIHVTSKTNLLGVNFRDFVGAKRVRKTKGSTKKERSETLNGLLGRVEKTLSKGLQRGLSAELLSIGESGRGAVSMGTGDIRKTIVNAFTDQQYKGVQQKGDVISVEVYNTEIDYQQYADDFYTAIQAGGEQGLNLLQQQLEKIITDTQDIYIVETNVKGYQSLRDIDFEREGSFYARMNNLYKMKSQFPQKSIDQLIFLLNNTMDDCVASHHKDALGDYFAAVFAAWMWDDYTEMFKLAAQDSAVKRIRIFNSGGLYFSASQLMEQTLNDLHGHADGTSFIYTEITPPSFNAHALYRDLKKQYPAENVPGGETRQNILAERWNKMRDKVMTEGRVSISIRQKQLEELFGKILNFM